MFIRILENLVTINNYDYDEIYKIDDSNNIVGIILDTRSIDVDDYPHLKVISRTGVGTDNIDMEKCVERGIKVCTAPCVELTQSAAEHTIYLILSLLRKNIKIRNLSAISVGIIGYGRIGKRVSDLISHFYRFNYDKTYIYDKYIDEWSNNFNLLLKDSDIITIHVSGNKQIIGAIELERMKDGAYLVNTARAECVDMEAVSEALKSGKLAGFASDVNSVSDAVKYQIPMKQCIFTPHIAGSTIEAKRAVEAMAINNLTNALKNEN